jgi:ATP-binding cassette subfamily B protein
VSRHPQEAASLSGPASRGTLLRFLLSFAWKYRFGCLRVLVLQICLLGMGLLGLGLMGTGIDYIRYVASRPAHGAASQVADAGSAAPHAEAGQPPAAVAPASGNRSPTSAATAKPPKWPFGLVPPPEMPPMKVLLLLAGGILGFALVRGGLNFAYTLAANRLVQGQIVVDLRAQVYEKMQRLSFRFFDANASASIINRVVGDVQSVRLFVDGVVLPCVVLVLSLVVYLGYMVRIHAGLTLACLGTTPLLWYVTRRFSQQMRPRYRRVRDLSDRVVRVLSECLNGVGVVKGFGLEKSEIAKFAEANRDVRDEQLKIFWTVSFFNPLMGFLSQVNMAVLLGYGGWLVIQFEHAPDAAAAAQAGVSIGQLLIFSGLLNQFSGQVANIANIANSVQQSLIAAQRVHEVLTAPLEIESRPDAPRLPQPRGAVAFENVAFGYDPAEPVLRDISFEVRPGECIAVLGATGSGKSTLMSLIPRFYDPTAGRVLVDGIDVRDLRVEDLRRSIGIVFQESFLFSTSVAANIAFGRPDASRAQIEQAARIAAADGFIRQLPKGYDTILHEGGANLSGGQRQRLAIARAILREPAILLLDDPTAAIDAHTENEILEAMEGAMAGRTTFVVAHRLSTLRRADRVLVLDHGRIAEIGTHAELMQRGGLYQEVVALQIADQEEAAPPAAPAAPPAGTGGAA